MTTGFNKSPGDSAFGSGSLPFRTSIANDSMTDERKSPNVKESKASKKNLFFWFKIFITGVLLYFLFRQVNTNELRRTVSDINVWWLLAGYGAIWSSLSIHTWRWQWLLKADGSVIPFKSLYRHYMIGYFFGHFLPRIVGGDVVRALSVSRFGESKTRSISIIMFGRLIGIANLLIIFIACIVFYPTRIQTFPISTEVAFVASAIVVGMVLVFFVVTSSVMIKAVRKLNPSITQIIDTLKIYRQRKKYLAIAFFASTFLQISVLLRHYCVAKAVGLDIDFATLSFVSILVMGLTTLPITVNGVGLRENGFVFLLGILLIPAEQALAFSLLNYALMISMATVGGIAYLRGVKDHRASKEEFLSIEELKERAAAV